MTFKDKKKQKSPAGFLQKNEKKKREDEREDVLLTSDSEAEGS